MKLKEWEDANPQNYKEELDGLIGLTITGYGYVEEDFLVLKVERNGEPITSDHGEEIALIVSRDAELNGGGYLGYIYPSEWEGKE